MFLLFEENTHKFNIKIFFPKKAMHINLRSNSKLKKTKESYYKHFIIKIKIFRFESLSLGS